MEPRAMIPEQWRKLAALASDPRAPEGEQDAARRKLAAAVHKHQAKPADGSDDWLHGPSPPQQRPSRWELTDAWTPWQECYRLVLAYVSAHPDLLERMGQRLYVESVAPDRLFRPTKNMGNALCGFAEQGVMQDVYSGDLAALKVYMTGRVQGCIPPGDVAAAANQVIHRDYLAIYDGAEGW